MAKLVTKEQFFDIIGPLDVVLSCKGARTDFCLRGGERVGYIEDDYIIPAFPLERCLLEDDYNHTYLVGTNDIELGQRLIRSGAEHRKFLRQIFVCVDITAPTYFMSELDTYKVGVTRNSSSFMHKGVSKPFEIEDFEIDDNRVIDILSIKKTRQNNQIEYPYETDEYKIYTTFNGRKYEVYKNGKIFALPFSYTDTMNRTRFFDRREVKPSVTKGGYWELNLGGRQRERWLLHRLVAHVWIENPQGYETVDHIDNNKSNNSVENLEWVSREENISRQVDDNLIRNNDIRANYLNWKASSKLSPFHKLKIIEMYHKGLKQKEIAEKFDVSQSQISVVIRGAKNTSEDSELFEECWIWEQLLNTLNYYRDCYIETKDIRYFRMIRQILPQAYLYHSTITMNYENVYSMIRHRKNHKLTEWRDKFINWARTLPYAKEWLFLDLEIENHNKCRFAGGRI